MAAEPKEEEIANFVNFTSSSREQAISFLKANNLNSNQAINAYFEDPTGPLTQANQYQNEPDMSAFQIEHVDSPYSPSAGPPSRPPPSRPPSTLNLRSSNDPASTQNNTADNGKGLTLAEQEERELQQAVAMSLSQNLGQQETGVTRAGNASFSRATRDHYDEGAWAMTLFNSSAHEIIISPDPTERKRREDEPAFIRPSQESTHLGGLVTILHSIPLAREALLLRNRSLPNYGHDSQWWNGQPINLPKIVTMSEAHEGDTDWDDIIYEAQRLVAFLDTTTRAFGSPDALASLQCISQHDRDSAVSRFLEAWQEAAIRADPGNQLGTIFSTTGYNGPMPAEGMMEQKEFHLLEPLVEHDPGQTLYDVLDRAFWCDRQDQPLEEVWLETLAEVLVMKLESSQKPLDVIVPTVFYADRYMANSRDAARDFRTRRLQAYGKIDKLDKAIKRYSQSNLTAQTGMTSRDVLEKAASAITSKFADSVSSDMDIENVAKQLRAVSARIEKQLRGLEDKKQRIRDSLRDHSKFLTEASPDAEPHYRYTLRGVCTEPHVTYVLKRRDQHVSSNNEPPTTEECQWWRFSFSTEDAAIRKAQSQGRVKCDSDQTDIIGYTARKVDEAEVLRAAREESNQVLLVYANTNAINMQEETAPVQLQKFVARDNETFESELQDAEMAHNPPATQHQSSGTLPSPNPEQQQPTQNVNVFDYQVPSFNETQGPGQEMQEINGRPLLSRSSTAGPVQPTLDADMWDAVDDKAT
ncbi:ubiquitin interaction motif protein [Aspergillus indologenus CBS 114.80]|uniref:Ubiquitin interaction motif protein n=1 Tax=Aspergillus indologenus CBS 114.80 TaxID=1450541 RepID=A0A2V5IQK8_9EURO|nr:ubiquitin interaction motif protein [Aspergillus indologenus CBS 114.80]